MNQGQPRKSSTSAVIVIVSVGAVSLLLCLGIAFLIFGFRFFSFHND